MHDSNFQGKGEDGVSQQYKNLKWSLHGTNSALQAASEKLAAAGLSGFTYYEETLILHLEINFELVK